MNGYTLITDNTGNTAWGATNPSAATLASIKLGNQTLGITPITNGDVPGAPVDQRFFQKFDETITDPNGRFNIDTGTYTASQSGSYLITAYIMPNAAPYRNTEGFYYPINLEVRKNCAGDPNGGVIVMDNSTIRYSTRSFNILRYSVQVTGMVSLSAGETLNLVVFLTGVNADAEVTSGMSFPKILTYANIADFKALFSVTAL